MGYSASELEDIQARWKVRFPPDLVDLLRVQRSPVEGEAAFDWLLSSPLQIQRCFDWPFESFWFDVQHANVWWSEWGPKPTSLAEQRDRLKQVFETAPKLIPLFGQSLLARGAV